MNTHKDNKEIKRKKLELDKKGFTFTDDNFIHVVTNNGVYFRGELVAEGKLELII